MSEPSLFSGKKIVLIIAVTAIVAWTVLLFTGLKAKHKRLDADGKPKIGVSDTLPSAE